MDSVNLFVYGTLMSGQSNHDLLETEIREGFAEYLGEGRLEGFVLYDRGDFPVAVPGRGSIRGECYRIPRPLLVGKLDRLEGFPHGFDRRTVEINGEPHWVYYRPSPPVGARRCGSGKWPTVKEGEAE